MSNQPKNFGIGQTPPFFLHVMISKAPGLVTPSYLIQTPKEVTWAAEVQNLSNIDEIVTLIAQCPMYAATCKNLANVNRKSSQMLPVLLYTTGASQ